MHTKVEPNSIAERITVCWPIDSVPRSLAAKCQLIYASCGLAEPFGGSSSSCLCCNTSREWLAATCQRHQALETRHQVPHFLFCVGQCQSFCRITDLRPLFLPPRDACLIASHEYFVEPHVASDLHVSPLQASPAPFHHLIHRFQ